MHSFDWVLDKIDNYQLLPWLSPLTTWQTEGCDLPILSNRILQAFSMNYANYALESNIPNCLLYFCHWHRTKFWFFAGVECTIISKGQNVLQTFQLLNTAGSCLQTTSLRNRWINCKEQTSNQKEHLCNINATPDQMLRHFHPRRQYPTVSHCYFAGPTGFFVDKIQLPSSHLPGLHFQGQALSTSKLLGWEAHPRQCMEQDFSCISNWQLSSAHLKTLYFHHLSSSSSAHQVLEDQWFTAVFGCIVKRNDPLDSETASLCAYLRSQIICLKGSPA